MPQDYPSSKELERIELWQHLPTLAAFIGQVWNTDYGTFDLNAGTLKLVTGGWSGNEDILAAMNKNMFWSCYWQRAERGGTFYFDDKLVAADLKWIIE